jgi:hypothetical protein
MSPHDVSTARQKKGIFGRVRAKAGQPHGAAPAFRDRQLAKSPEKNAASASRADQCYQPGRAEFAAVIPKRNAKNCIVFEAKITTS